MKGGGGMKHGKSRLVGIVIWWFLYVWLFYLKMCVASLGLRARRYGLVSGIVRGSMPMPRGV